MLSEAAGSRELHVLPAAVGRSLVHGLVAALVGHRPGTLAFIVTTWRAGRPPGGRALAAHATDLGHVPAVQAHPFTALTTGRSGLVGGELVGGPALVRGLPALAGDFPL